jgi:addiction module RelE/StbE family toxin
MDREIRWSPEALEDIDAIAEWVNRDSPIHAASLVDRFAAAAESLTRNAERGRKVPELQDPACRELFVQSYRLIYRVDKAVVLVLAVVHGRRLLDGIEERLDG